MDGRLLHVRILLEPEGKHSTEQGSLDVIAVYQQAWDNDPAKHARSKRLSLLHELSCLLKRLPKRNMLALAGDFNTSLRPFDQYVGPGVVRGQTASQPDREDLLAIIEANQLQALNTWGAKSKASTFSDRGYDTQIDFIFVRVCDSDAAAMSTVTKRELQFSPWRGGGGHYPVIASIAVARRSRELPSLRDHS
jgi:hypothetical protein